MQELGLGPTGFTEQGVREEAPARIGPGMQVCDIGGHKIGKAVKVHKLSEQRGARLDTPGEDFIEVSTGLLGLGQRLWIPFSAVHDVVDDCVFLRISYPELEQQNWWERPLPN